MFAYLQKQTKSKQMYTKEITRKRKSELLTKDELLALKKKCKAALYIQHVADEIGISRQVLERLLLLGKSSPETITKVRAVISEVA